MITISKKDTQMDEFQLLIDLHKGANRQGPGGDSETEKAIELACIDRNAQLKIADIGCGTGSSTLDFKKASPIGNAI